ncbi:MAG: nitroreductase family protein [Candidatus Lindowbacteria bacterium]|nr:nitroreductase family protein [Candidatus Lindowbacteria bacterium]
MIEKNSQGMADVVLKNISTRWSCRVFSDEAVPKSTVSILLDAANCAPSPMNTQPWEFVVLTGEPLMRFRENVGEWLKTPEPKGEHEVNLLPEGDYCTSLPKRLADRKKEHLERMAKQAASVGMSLKEAYPFTFYCYNAPVVIMVVGDTVKRDRHGLEIHQALAAAIQNILLAAHSMGYGACWIGDIMRFGKRLHDHLRLDSMKEVVGAVALGRPDMDSPVNRQRVPKRAPKVEWRGY